MIARIVAMTTCVSSNSCKTEYSYNYPKVMVCFNVMIGTFLLDSVRLRI